MPSYSDRRSLTTLIEFLAAKYSFRSEDWLEFPLAIFGGALFHGFTEGGLALKASRAAVERAPPLPGRLQGPRATN